MPGAGAGSGSGSVRPEAVTIDCLHGARSEVCATAGFVQESGPERWAVNPSRKLRRFESFTCHHVPQEALMRCRSGASASTSVRGPAPRGRDDCLSMTPSTHLSDASFAGNHVVIHTGAGPDLLDRLDRGPSDQCRALLRGPTAPHVLQDPWCSGVSLAHETTVVQEQSVVRGALLAGLPGWRRLRVVAVFLRLGRHMEGYRRASTEP